MAGVVDLQLRLDPEFLHAPGQPGHIVRRVAELPGAERHRARIQGGHPGPELDEGGALLKRHGEPDPGG